MLKLINVFKYYSIPELLKSILISFLFFAIPASIIIIAGTETILLMIPDMVTIMGVMYILLLLTLSFSTKILIETLKNYTIYNEIDYKVLYSFVYYVMAVIITIIEVVIILIF